MKWYHNANASPLKLGTNIMVCCINFRDNRLVIKIALQ